MCAPGEHKNVCQGAPVQPEVPGTVGNCQGASPAGVIALIVVPIVWESVGCLGGASVAIVAQGGRAALLVVLGGL